MISREMKTMLMLGKFIDRGLIIIETKECPITSQK